MNCSEPTTNEVLPVLFCQVLDLDEHKKCVERDLNVTICIICPIIGRFLTGEDLGDISSRGHIVCLFLWSLTVIIGVLGVVTNVLIIFVTRRLNSKRPFDLLVIFLAAFDMLCCGTALIGTTAHVALYQSWVQKDFATIHWLHKFNQATLLGRTGSTYMAMLITIERFLAITFPFRMKNRLTSCKTILLAVGVILVSLLINVPRFLMFEVVPNRQKYENLTTLQDSTYIIGVTQLFGMNMMCFFREKFGDINEHLDFLAPLPILLIFNIVSYLKVRQMQKGRKQLNIQQKAEIEALKIFLPVVIVYFSTNIVPFVQFGNAISTGIFYREVNIAVGLSIVINSAINFHIYYYQRSAFEAETKALFCDLYKRFFCFQSERSHSCNADSGSSHTSRL